MNGNKPEEGMVYTIPGLGAGFGHKGKCHGISKDNTIKDLCSFNSLIGVVEMTIEETFTLLYILKLNHASLFSNIVDTIRSK